MDKERYRELEKPATWDFERPQVREPVRTSRVVVSVGFRRDDFATVSEYAESIGMKTSEFIREAAIEKATGRGSGTLGYGSGSMGTLWWIQQMPTITVACGSPVEHPEKALVTTY